MFSWFFNKVFIFSFIIGVASSLYSLELKKEPAVDFLREVPLHLRPYVLCRLELLEDPKLLAEIKKVNKLLYKDMVETKRNREIERITEMFMQRLAVNFDFDVKYKKIKRTREKEYPSLLLNYRAREEEIAEGFEAGEIVWSYIKIHPKLRVVTHIALYEKWVKEKKDYEVSYQIDPYMIPEYNKTIVGTFKYAVGCEWNVYTEQEKKMVLELLLQQKTNQQWSVKDVWIPEGKVKGFLLDHLVLTINFDF